MITWQPMTTAPKDRPILVFCKGGFGHQIVQWNDDRAEWQPDSRLGLNPNWPPVCWAELTDPPAEGAAFRNEEIDRAKNNAVITPEMIAEGVRIFVEWEESEEYDLRSAVALIFLAMRDSQAEPHQEASPAGGEASRRIELAVLIALGAIMTAVAATAFFLA